jgi:hypothetical protein
MAIAVHTVVLPEREDRAPGDRFRIDKENDNAD